MSVNSLPSVSVVMSVYNGAEQLSETVESILQQTHSDFEFIIVNDGSADATPEILTEYQRRDPRIRIVNQPNQGLTMALNAGCRLARGAIIARQDIGDRSLPDRLQKQLAFLAAEKKVVAVGVGSQRIGPGGENLGKLSRTLNPEAVTSLLHQEGIGIMHASSAFRKHAFDRVGGYRPEFRYAQDTDLWYRMSETGLLAELPDVLFQVRIELSGISAQQIEKQIELARLAREGFERRKRNQPEDDLLLRAREVSQQGTLIAASAKKRQLANSAYFIGGLLMDRRDSRCRTYFRKSMTLNGPFCQAAAKYLLSFSRCRGNVTPDPD